MINPQPYHQENHIQFLETIYLRFRLRATLQLILNGTATNSFLVQQFLQKGDYNGSWVICYIYF